MTQSQINTCVYRVPPPTPWLRFLAKFRHAIEEFLRDSRWLILRKTPDRSRWIVHAQPNQQMPPTTRILPTAVGGSFIHNLQKSTRLDA